MEWIGLLALVVILLKTIEKGGDWFDFFDSNARYQNCWVNFEFNTFFVFLCILIFGGSAWLLFSIMKQEIHPRSSYQPASLTIAPSKSKRINHIQKTHILDKHLHINH